jgi:hypothetical protein
MNEAVNTVATTTIGESETTTDSTTIPVTTVGDTSEEGGTTTNTETDTDTDTDDTTTGTDTTTAETDTETDTEETTTTDSGELFGYTVDEVTDIAKDLYSKACKKYRSVLMDGAYIIDYNKSVSDQYGKRYYLVNDPYYPSTENVFEDWPTVFTNAYDDLVSSAYVMYDGGMYAYVTIQQENTNYDSTTLTYYYLTSDYELTFKATNHYSSGDKVFKFAITYNPDTQEWRVSKFTMPY